MITEDNLVVNIDTVLYFQITDPKAATYEIADYLQAIDQLTVTTLRNVIGSMDLEQTLTSREEINTRLRMVLDEATGKWGIRVNRVEIKAIDPPTTIKEAMEKQMRAERDKRASHSARRRPKQAQILTAEGEQQRRFCGRRATGGRGPGRRGSGEGSRDGLPGSPRTTPIPSCLPISTWRCCRSSRRASRTRCGSSQARSRRRSAISSR